MNNYYSVLKSLDSIPNVVAHFDAEILSARKELSLSAGKTIERHASELPAIVEIRFSQLQEIEAILEYLNKLLDKKKSEKFKLYFEKYQRALTAREVDKYIDGDDDVFNMHLLVNEIALLRNRYLAVMKGIDTKNWMISNVTKLRVAGMDDAKLD